MKRFLIQAFLVACLVAGTGCSLFTRVVNPQAPATMTPAQPSTVTASLPTSEATQAVLETTTPADTPLPLPSATGAPQATSAPLAATAPADVIDKPAGASSQQSIGDSYIPELGNTGYDVQHYTLRFALDPAQEMVHGRATIEALSTLDNLAQVSLDFIGFDITQLTVDGQPGAFTRRNDKLIVNLPGPLGKGKPFSIEVTYSGPPEPATSPFVDFVDQMGFTFQPKFGSVFAMSEPDGARHWYPCNDHPRDKASFLIELSVPEKMQGIANGVLVKTETEVPNLLPDGRAGDRFTWEMKEPMATYLATVVVGTYSRIDGATPKGVKMRSYVYPDQREAFAKDLPLSADALDWFASKLGPYPFDAFGYVMVGETNFSMETQTMVMESSAMGTEALIHELSHQWFGDWVSLDSWADIWRNEGFATYMTALYFTKGDMGQMDQIAQRWETAMRKRPPSFALNDPPDQAMFSQVSYIEGALLVHDLHKTMGDDAFYQGLRAYFKTYGGKSASFEQFKAEMEKAYGKPLTPIFDKWFAPGLP